MSETIDKKEIAKQYVKASVHYGHPPKEWNPKMAPYILYAKYGYHIFDLVKTSKLLRLAGNVLQKKQKKVENFYLLELINYLLQLLQNKLNVVIVYYINYRWLGGMLTNWSTIQKRIEELKELEEQEIDGTLEQLSKKEYS